MGTLKRVPVLSKDLLEDTPVPRGCCNHRVAPSWGDTIVMVQRLYHGLAASSTPHRPVYHHPPLLPSSLSYRDFWAEKMKFPIRSRWLAGKRKLPLGQLSRIFPNSGQRVAARGDAKPYDPEHTYGNLKVSRGASSCMMHAAAPPC